jgi:hypothetical protein
MKFTTLIPLSLSLLASTTLAVSVTQIQKGGTERELNIATDGECVDLFQGCAYSSLQSSSTVNREWRH